MSHSTARILTAFALSITAGQGAAWAAEPSAQTCSTPAISKNVRFAIGEKLEYDIDSLGATVGSFSLTLGPANKPNAYTIIARGKTDSFASNFYSVDATAESYLGRGLENRRYIEDATEAKIRRTVEVSFPPNQDQKLSVRATKQGTREDYSTLGAPDTRDMLAALYAVRQMPLDDGSDVCMPIFGARRVWTLRAQVVGREKVRTPSGEYKAIHLQGKATRIDSPTVSREVHFWYSDDAARIPVAALGLIQDKPVRAQLVKYTAGRAGTSSHR